MRDCQLFKVVAGAVVLPTHCPPTLPHAPHCPPYPLPCPAGTTWACSRPMASTLPMTPPPAASYWPRFPSGVQCAVPQVVHSPLSTPFCSAVFRTISTPPPAHLSPVPRPPNPPPPLCSKGLTFGASDVRELVTLLDSGAAAPYAVGGGAAGGGSAAAAGGGGAQSQGAVVVRPSR